jgi:NAD(P)-dependent dehydrogenase (short-subunit alcohol dehydrogenase family)
MVTMSEHAGRVAVITGGGSGVGRAAAELLAERGAAVVIGDRDGARAGAVADGITAAGGQAVAVPADVTKAADAVSVVEAAVRSFDRVDMLVTSAGIQRYGTVADTDEQTWDEVFAVNVKGVYLAARAAIPWLRRTSGAIVVVSSVQALCTQANVAAYTASKGALNALVRAMAVDEAAHGVRVNAVCPGSVDTPMLRASAALFSDGTPAGADRLIAGWGRDHPLGRVARPREVAEVIAFLAGARASFLTGEEIAVDGGLLARLAVALPDAAHAAHADAG